MDPATKDLVKDYIAAASTVDYKTYIGTQEKLSNLGADRDQLMDFYIEATLSRDKRIRLDAAEKVSRLWGGIGSLKMLLKVGELMQVRPDHNMSLGIMRVLDLLGERRR